MLNQSELVDRVRRYNPDCDVDLLNRAYVFSMKAHSSQLRASGDPYFKHPIEVAGILADLKLDDETIATGILHDAIEDTVATQEEIDRLFGSSVGRLVNGVTKLSRIEMQIDSERHAQNLRNVLLAMSSDIRVLLVKLADRLHNMRTLHVIKSEDKRRRIARETIDIYAPLAERIGMYGFMDELQELAFRQLEPGAYETIAARLAKLRNSDGDTVTRIASEMKLLLAQKGIEADVTGREKRPHSIWRKMQGRNTTFEALSDVMAFRVITADEAECYRALGVVQTRWPMVPGRFKDFISTPKANGYRSLHTSVLLGSEAARIEVQIRTRTMHEEAEYGLAAHWAYKQGGDGASAQEAYPWIDDLLDVLQDASNPEDLLDNGRLAMFQDQVLVFTPKGELHQLPQHSTPVDFAYAVHSDVGDSCVGAKLNGRVVPLRTRLVNGDQVEILKGKVKGPDPAWLGFVATKKARDAIRRHIRETGGEELASVGDLTSRSEHYITSRAAERILQQAASPRIITKGRKIDATNGEYEKSNRIPIEWLPRHLRDCAHILHESIGPNAPNRIRTPLSVYVKTIEENLRTPILQTLIFSATMVEQAMEDTDFEFWSNGLELNFRLFLSDHRLLVDNYPELQSRQAELMKLPVNFSANIDLALSEFNSASSRILELIVSSEIATDKVQRILEHQLALARAIVGHQPQTLMTDRLGDSSDKWTLIHDQAANNLGVWLQIRDNLEILISRKLFPDLELSLPTLLSSISKLMESFIDISD